MFIGAVLVAILCAWGCFRGLNEGLPKRIIRQSFGLIEFFYRFLNVIAPMSLLYSLLAFKFHLPSIIIGIILYASAYLVKKIVWKSTYGDYLD